MPHNRHTHETLGRMRNRIASLADDELVTYEAHCQMYHPGTTEHRLVLDELSSRRVSPLDSDAFLRFKYHEVDGFELARAIQYLAGQGDDASGELQIAQAVAEERGISTSVRPRRRRLA